MNLSQSAALFLFAHQDDEFGVFQKIIDEHRSGRRIFCAYLTTGVSAGQSSVRRNSESLAVLTQLGVQAIDVIFAGQALSIPDGGLPDHLQVAGDWIENRLANCQPLAAIYLPAWEGGHHDHDALHAIGAMGASKAGLLAIVRQFSLYHGCGSRGLLFRVLLPLSANGAFQVSRVSWSDRFRFLRYCLSYPSQTGSWLGLFPFVLLHFVFQGTQSVQPVSLLRIRQRPHNGPLYYERRHFYTWEKMNSRLFEYRCDRPGSL